MSSAEEERGCGRCTSTREGIASGLHIRATHVWCRSAARVDRRDTTAESLRTRLVGGGALRGLAPTTCDT
eukprot:1820039-Prymnesium_polylepis.1